MALRGAHTAIAFFDGQRRAGRIYVLGGTASNNTVLQTVEYLDVGAGAAVWETAPSMAAARFYLAATTVSGACCRGKGHRGEV